MALALFVIVVDALFYILRSTHLGSLVKGLILPNNDDLLIEQFVDDTGVFVEMNENKFNNMLGRIHLFCLALGAKISPMKSIILGWNDTPHYWLNNKGWKWQGPNDIVRYLGIPFALNPSTKEMWN